jgi:adenylosuccinate lyase
MQWLFSADFKFSTWRRLWVALAEAEKELGLNITDAQIDAMKAHITDIDYEFAARMEKEVRHDVMAHIHAYEAAAPEAKGIIHLGATSCYVGDNTDIIIFREALTEVKRLLLGVISALCDLAEAYRAQPCLAYTHFQAAQPTTFGKRVTLWLQDFMLDLTQIDYALGELKLLGCRGTTGTAASFYKLFDGDRLKVHALEEKIAVAMGFPKDAVFDVSGQTYPRKLDSIVLSALSGIAQSAYKFSGDIRLLSHLKAVDEPFEDKQVGSSAMAYKRNPMRSERIASLSRYVITTALNPAITAGTQWFERTLDDSANRRICIPETFLAVDGILSLVINIVSGLDVYPKVLEKQMLEELPYMATENIIMEGVKRGGDRQELHEAIRILSVECQKDYKTSKRNGDLLGAIAADRRFGGVKKADLLTIMIRSDLTGLAAEQTSAYVRKVRRMLKNNTLPLPNPEIKV